uniref:Uncharacterized protein n=1 Tax=Lactuca sativa TaxID=4236 RepID=A0A9R1XGN8_LACSA|nr:hypothetical protein LSAT_V11C400193650 [Lactuca sativa]
MIVIRLMFKMKNISKGKKIMMKSIYWMMINLFFHQIKYRRCKFNHDKYLVTSLFEDKQDIVLEVPTSRSTHTCKTRSNVSPKTKEFMNIVARFPDFQEGSMLYFKALCHYASS